MFDVSGYLDNSTDKSSGLAHTINKVKKFLIVTQKQKYLKFLVFSSKNRNLWKYFYVFLYSLRTEILAHIKIIIFSENRNSSTLYKNIYIFLYLATGISTRIYRIVLYLPKTEFFISLSLNDGISLTIFYMWL